MEKTAPIAVFDSGVGSYSIVRVLQKELPHEHIIYLADRASFPYGGKSREALKDIVHTSIAWLEAQYRPKIIIVASNTPSIQVLDEVKKEHTTTLIGVFPPLEKAVKLSKTKHVALLATKGAVVSSEIDDYIKSKNLSPEVMVHKVNASDLVALVEPGTFQTDVKGTESVIKSVLDPVLAADALIDVMTLSSTHLPFLCEYLAQLYPHIAFLDPAQDVVSAVRRVLGNENASSTERGSLTVLATSTEDGRLTPTDLQKTLSLLGLDANVKTVTL